MLAVAADRAIYRTVSVADITATGQLKVYDLCIQSLADEHLPDLRPLYGETARCNAGLLLVGLVPVDAMRHWSPAIRRFPPLCVLMAAEGLLRGGGAPRTGRSG